jgi:hypothetical protein
MVEAPDYRSMMPFAWLNISNTEPRAMPTSV